MSDLASPEHAPSPASVYFRSGQLRMHATYWPGSGGVNLVVIPGITTPAAAASSFARRLALQPSAGDVYVLDTRGRGLSERSPFGTHRAADYADDVLALIDSEAIRSPVLIGHSMGGRVAAAARVRFPGASSGVVVIDPPTSRPGGPPYPIPLARMLDGVLSARRGNGRADVAAQNPHWDYEQVAERGDWLGMCDELAVVESFAHFHLEAFEPVWREVPSPALLIVGGQSPVVPAATAEQLASINPPASLVSVPDSGHMVPMDNPDETITAIEKFLADL